MEGSAPKEVIHYKDQEISDMRQKVAPEVSQLTGHLVNPEALNPNDETPLQKIEEDLKEAAKDMGNYVGTFGQEIAGNPTYIRTTGDIGLKIMEEKKVKEAGVGRKILNFAQEKLLRTKQKQLVEKAA